MVKEYHVYSRVEQKPSKFPPIKPAVTYMILSVPCQGSLDVMQVQWQPPLTPPQGGLELKWVIRICLALGPGGQGFCPHLDQLLECGAGHHGKGVTLSS